MEERRGMYTLYPYPFILSFPVEYEAYCTYVTEYCLDFVNCVILAFLDSGESKQNFPQVFGAQYVGITNTYL